MTVDPSRHDTTDKKIVEITPDSALPPTLFSLPNLSYSDETCTENLGDTCMEDPGETCGEEADEAAAGESNAFESQGPQPHDIDEEETEVRFEPVPEPAKRTTVETSEPAPESNQSVPAPTSQTTETPTAKKESLMNVWGTRAVVIGLLLLAVTSAVVAARRKPKTSTEQQIAADQEVDELLNEGFAISQGEPIIDSFEPPTSAMEEALVQAGQPSAKQELAASQQTIHPITTEGPTATLAAPLVAKTDITSNAVEPTADVANLETANLGPVDSVSAAAASSRGEVSEFPVGPPPTSEPVSTLNAPTVFAATPAAPNTAAPATPDIANPKIAVPENAFPKVTNPESTQQVAKAAVKSVSHELAKPVTSDPVRFSSTPNAIGDLLRFVPAKTEKTPTP